MLTHGCYRFAKYTLPTVDDVQMVREVGSAYAQDSAVRGLTVTFKIDVQKYSSFLDLMIGWNMSLTLPSAYDRAQFHLADK